MKFYKRYLLWIYSLWARAYDNYIDPRFSFDRKKVINSLHIKQRESILEIGVGTGLNLPYYPPNSTVTGIDFSKEMLRRATEKTSKATVKLEVMDATKLTFQNNSFDKALTTYVVRVSPHPEKIFSEAARVVKNKGLFCIVDRFRENDREMSVVSKIKFFLEGGGQDYSLLRLIKNTSWKIVSSEKIGSWKGTELIILKNNKSESNHKFTKE